MEHVNLLAIAILGLFAVLFVALAKNQMPRRKNQLDRNTERKAEALIKQGHQFTGVVLTDSQGQKSIVEHGCVRHLSNIDFQIIMHDLQPYDKDDERMGIDFRSASN